MANVRKVSDINPDNTAAHTDGLYDSSLIRDEYVYIFPNDALAWGLTSEKPKELQALASATIKAIPSAGGVAAAPYTFKSTPAHPVVILPQRFEDVCFPD